MEGVRGLREYGLKPETKAEVPEVLTHIESLTGPRRVGMKNLQSLRIISVCYEIM